MNLEIDPDNSEKFLSSYLGSPIVYNSKINLTYSPSQDFITQFSPSAGLSYSSEVMSKQLKEAIVNERNSFVKRCDEIKNEIRAILAQID